ncbi:MAG: alpha-L-fucosidase [Planctomycetes bacterium]|nr:alpha-L-fucosidase [Planctomycetota bacterium]
MAVKQSTSPKMRHGDTSWFVQDRFGMFIHWGTYSLAARHEWVKNHEKLTQDQYQKYFDHFYPDLYDPKEWARLARQAGMKYAVLTTKHHEGFCLWDTKYTDYKATKTRWGKDLLKPFVEAFRDEGLRVGFYYSLLDWHHPQYTVDRCHPQREDAEARKLNAKKDMKIYAKYMRDQVTELLTKFGKVDVIWFDFSFGGDDGKGRDHWESQKLFDVVRKLQPDILIDNRLDLPGSGDFVTPEQWQPAKPMTDENGKPIVWEACQTFSGSWGYYRDELNWREPDELLRTLIDCVSKNGNLLLNVGPTGRGEFDDRAQSRLKYIGDWMHRHGRSIYGCQAAPPEFPCPPGCNLTYNPKEKRLYLHVLNWPYKHIHLTGKAYVEHLAYAQFLHDASEVIMGLDSWHAMQQGGSARKDSVSINLPQMKPNVAVPVVEFFLK